MLDYEMYCNLNVIQKHSLHYSNIPVMFSPVFVCEFKPGVHVYFFALLKENVAMMAKGFAESTSMVVGRYPLSCS